MFVALREIRRAKGKFALLGSAVGLLVFLLLFFQAVAGTLVSGLTGSVEQSSADVLVYSERARRNPNASVLSPEAVEAVRAVDGVAQAGAIGQTVFTGTGADGQVDLVLIGVAAGGPEADTTLEVVGVVEDAAANVSPTLYTTFDTYAAAVRARGPARAGHAGGGASGREHRPRRARASHHP
ncbi:MAG: hypothetical protein ACR2MA_01100 [Egibacteraceae bacterium]